MYIAWKNSEAKSERQELPKPRTLEEVEALLSEMKKKWDKQENVRKSLELIVTEESENG